MHYGSLLAVEEGRSTEPLEESTNKAPAIPELMPDFHILFEAGCCDAASLRGLIQKAQLALNELHGAQEEIALSRRETEVLTWVAKGKSNAATAAILGISSHTVDTHLRRVFEKFDTTSRTVAAVRAVQYGLLPDVA